MYKNLELAKVPLLFYHLRVWAGMRWGGRTPLGVHEALEGQSATGWRPQQHGEVQAGLDSRAGREGGGGA